MLVSIVTATTGNPLLKQAIESVQTQDYDNIEHLIIIDGKEREEAANQVLSNVTFTKPYNVLTLPYPTGLNGYVCHRIYASSGYLINGDYVVFLDDDNWLEPYHISSLVDLVYQEKLDWAYSLRNIVNDHGDFITQDNCQSLGKWICEVFPGYHHIDTNCYFIKKEIAIKLSPIWYKSDREPGLTADMLVCAELLKHFPNCDTNGLYSVNYRLGSTDRTVKPSYFLYGNSLVKSEIKVQFPDGYPWRKNLRNYHEELQANLRLRDKNFITFPDWQVEDTDLIKNDLGKLIEAILNHPEKTKINLLIFVQESLAEKAEILLWDLMLNYLDANELESELPEITITHEMSPVRWSYLLPSLTGYVTIGHQDSTIISQTIQDKLTALTTEEITNGQVSERQIDSFRNDEKIHFQSIVNTYNYPKHFIILGHPGCGNLFLHKILNQHSQIFCAGEIFHCDPNHKDVIYARNIMKTQEKLKFLYLPYFYDKCSLKESKEIIGFSCFYPPINSMNISEIEILIESGYKIIFLKRRNLHEAFYSWIKDIQSQEEQEVYYNQPSNEKLVSDPFDTSVIEQWIGDVEKHLEFFRQKLDKRLNGYLNIDYEDLCGDNSNKSKNTISKIFDYLEEKKVAFRE